MNTPKITIITVSYNCVDIIEKTILSVINQSYPSIEYIIIDGASTDGTVDIIKKYQDKIAYCVSESDGGIYEAMNKGIDQATGEWINFMNCGDLFSSNNVLSLIFDNVNYNGVDIIYGNSTMVDYNYKVDLIAGNNPNDLVKYAIYRHGASFVSTPVHKNFKFDISKKSKLGFALDFNCIYQLFLANKNFKKVDVNILTFIKEGVSDQPIKSTWYNYLIINGKVKPSFAFIKACLKIFILYILSFNFLRKIVFFKRPIINGIFYVKNKGEILLGAIIVINSGRKHNTIGGDTKTNIIVTNNAMLRIGNNVGISNSTIFCKNSIIIEDNVLIGANCKIYDSDFHSVDYNDRIEFFINNQIDTKAKIASIHIKRGAWIGGHCIVLKGVTIGEKSIIGAGSVVVKNIPDNEIWAGNPAIFRKKIFD